MGLPSEKLGRSLVPYRKDNLPIKETKILKGEISVLPIWFGRRMYDDSDFKAFYQASYWLGNFKVYPLFQVSDADEIEESSPLKPVAFDLTQVLNRIETPLVVFVVTTPKVAESSWLDHFSQGVQEYRRIYNKRDDTLIYKIIMGGGRGFSETGKEDPKGHFWPDEMSAHELNGIYLYYDSDAPSAGSQRLVGFMRRLLGDDLPGEEFPNYNTEDTGKIAWNINRESFNSFSPKEGAIDKYPIIDGKPLFPF